MLNQYYDAVKEINNNRTQNNTCDVVDLFSKVKNPSGLDIVSTSSQCIENTNSIIQKQSQKSVQKAWTVLKHIAQGQGHYLKSYISQPYHHMEAVESRRNLIHASKSWLEKQ